MHHNINQNSTPMKKLFISCLTALAMLQAWAQVWNHSVIKGDELLGTTNSIQHKFTSGDKVFIFWSDKKDDLRIISLDEPFDIETRIGASGNFLFSTKVGLYDESGNLVEKFDMLFEIDSKGQPNQAHPNKYTRMGGNNKKNAKKVIEYLTTKKGFVRIVANLYGTNELFDLSINCLN